MNEKKIHYLTIFVVGLAVILASVLLLAAGTTQQIVEPVDMPYETVLFGEHVFSVDILADEETWHKILDTAIEEVYTPVDVIVNGVLFENVGIRPKGNSSLLSVAMNDETDRFSFKIKFDEYVEGQTCFGLDVLILNNLIDDPSYMKEYISFDMMHYLGVDAPLQSYCDIKLNGETWGLYLGLEGYNNSFQKRVYGDSNGYLYSAKTADLTKGMGMPDPSTMQIGGGGLDLVYTGDATDAYSGLFDNNVGGTANQADYQRVVRAIEKLNSKEEIESYWDVEQIIPYIAAHTVTVNTDSYTSMMCQNYYMYEKDGKVSILPWDYSATFGGMMSGDLAQQVVNFPIDTPFYQTTLQERPLYARILENEVYLKSYYEALDKLTVYLETSSERIDRLHQQIKDYVRNDATHLGTYEDYEGAQDVLAEILELRGKSIEGQLERSIPSTTQEQQVTPEKCIDTSHIDMSKFILESQTTQMMHPGDMRQMPSMDAMKEVMEIIKNTSIDELTNEQKESLLEKGISEAMLQSMKEMGDTKMPMPVGSGGTLLFDSILKVIMCIGLSLILWLAMVYVKKIKG